MKVDALILAGGSVDNFAPERRPQAKGLLEIAGKPMVEYVLEALAAGANVGKLVVLAPSVVSVGKWASLAEKVIPSDGLITENIARGIEYLGTEGRFLLVSSDIPLISGRAIDDLVERCAEIDADLYYPIISRESVEKKLPGTKRTYIKLRDGVFTGGNIFLVDKKTFLNNRENGEKIFAFRKNPIKLVQLLGLGFVLKFLLRQLTITELEAKAGQILACKVRAVITDYAEIGVDVDKQEDLVIFETILGSNSLIV